MSNMKQEGINIYLSDPDYANRRSFLYLTEVANVVDKIGITFDLRTRARDGKYTNYWWTRELSRAETWCVEQVALHLTRDWSVNETTGYTHKDLSGLSEQRTGWVIEEIILLLEELVVECQKEGWKDFYYRYLPTNDYAAYLRDPQQLSPKQVSQVTRELTRMADAILVAWGDH